MKPMFAVKADLDKLRYPLMVSSKLDGIRAVVKDGEVLSKSMKPIRNEHVQRTFKDLHGVDGELIVGDILAEDAFQVTTSGVMTKIGEPDVKFYVFDRWDFEGSFEERIKHLPEGLNIILVEQVIVNNYEELMEEYQRLVKMGYEGAMLRDPTKPYKFGTATVNSQELLKMKPFEDAEFEVVGFTELMTNNNKAKKNALGNTERSSCKDGLVPANTLGALVVRYEDTTFEVGTGFTQSQRKEIWKNRLTLVGSLAKVRYQKTGMKDLPRFPSFQGFRDKSDMS